MRHDTIEAEKMAMMVLKTDNRRDHAKNVEKIDSLETASYCILDLYADKGLVETHYNKAAQKKLGLKIHDELPRELENAPRNYWSKLLHNLPGRAAY